MRNSVNSLARQSSSSCPVNKNSLPENDTGDEQLLEDLTTERELPKNIYRKKEGDNYTPLLSPKFLLL